MSYGLQTTDAAGNIVIRVTDRLTRFVTQATVSLGTYGQTVDIGVGGMVDDGTWVAFTDSIFMGVTIYSGFVRVRCGKDIIPSPIAVTVTVLRV